MTYNWQQKDWTAFKFEQANLEDLLLTFTENTGLAKGLLKTLPEQSQKESLIDMLVSEAIGRYKKANNISILQQKRWAELLEAVQMKGASHGLGNAFISTFLKAIHEESIEHQNKVMNEKD